MKNVDNNQWKKVAETLLKEILTDTKKTTKEGLDKEIEDAFRKDFGIKISVRISSLRNRSAYIHVPINGTMTGVHVMI